MSRVRSVLGKMARGSGAEYVMNRRGERERRRRRRRRPIVGAGPLAAGGPRAKHHFPISWAGRRKSGSPATYLAAMIITLALLAATAPGEAVDCFKCSSRNGSNPACEDPFHNLNTSRVNTPVLPDPPPNVIYHTPCYAGRKGREGLFPASACIKLTGTFDHTGETLVVRHCALDSGTLTQDTELGCVMACPNDACNGARPTGSLVAAGATQFLLTSYLAAAFLYLYAAT